jgi:hypothetical protein
VAFADTTTGATAGQRDLAVTLAPLFGVALAIERLWETVFGMVEGLMIKSSRLIGWAAAEFDAASKAAETAAAEFRNDPTNAPKFAAAEQRLLEAEARLLAAPRGARYQAVKRAVTLVGSLILGIVAAFVAGLQMFQQSGFALPSPVDTFLTGLIIGAGPGPLHSVIGGLQELRNAFGGLADLARGGGIKRASEGLSQAVETVRRARREATTTDVHDAGSVILAQSLVRAALRPR